MSNHPISEVITTDPVQARAQKPQSPLAGFGLAGAFLWWGFLVTFTPVYLEFGGGGAIVCIGLGILLISISLMGTLFEIGKLLQRRSMYWRGQGLIGIGVTALFLIPTTVLFLSLRDGVLPIGELVTARLVTLILAAIAGFFLSMSLADMLTADAGKPIVTPGAATEMTPEAKHRNGLQIFFSALIAILAVVADVLGIIQFITALVAPSK